MNYRLLLVLMLFSMAVSLTGCTLDLSILSESPSESPAGNLLVFDSSYIDTSLLSSKIQMSSTNASSGNVQINFEMPEGVQRNKVLFKNLPDGAVITCDNTAGNRALQRMDLVGEKSFQLQPTFWVPTDAEWTAQEHQSFSCYYEVNGQKSNTIEFKVQLKEASPVLVSAPQYTGLEKYGGSYDSVISADGRYIAQTVDIGVVGEDINGFSDIYLYDKELGKITLISKNFDGTVGDGHSTRASINSDGRYIAFSSYASNLVSGDTNNTGDIFVHDTQTGITKMVSVASNGTQGNSSSEFPSISADGRYIAFISYASNLVSGDTNSHSDIFVHDTQTGTTTRVSVDSSGNQGNNSSSTPPSISADGRYVVFDSEATNLVSGDTNNWSDVFVYDTQTGTTTRVSVAVDGSEGSASSQYPRVSADGRYVTFVSGAYNFVSGDNNGVWDVFVKDTQSGTVTRASVDSGGVEANSMSSNASISANGRYVTFCTNATNLVAGDSNGRKDLFVHDTQAGTTKRVSIDSSGNQGNGDSCGSSISADGRYVSFYSQATNLVIGDVNNSDDNFVHDVQTNVTIKVPLETTGTYGDVDSYSPSVSVDGRYVAFASSASNLVSGDTNDADDIFVRDNQTGVITKVSVDSDGAQGDDGSYEPSISSDGRYIAFESWATNLVSGDTNGNADIFIRDTQTGTTTRVSIDSSGIPGDSSSYKPSISADGRYVAFSSHATNLVSGDTNNRSDVFVHDTQTGTTIRVSVDSSGNQGTDSSHHPSISADGRYVAFMSQATNLVGGDTNSRLDVFVHDTQTGTTVRVSVDSSGMQGNQDSNVPSISADGRYVAFESSASNLVSGDINSCADIFVHDTQTGTTSSITQGNFSSYAASISADGRYVAFESNASNLVSGDTNNNNDAFVHDTQTGTTTRVSVDSNGTEGWSYSYEPSISADGGYVVFTSQSENWIENDLNYDEDVMLSRNPLK